MRAPPAVAAAGQGSVGSCAHPVCSRSVMEDSDGAVLAVGGLSRENYAAAHRRRAYWGLRRSARRLLLGALGGVVVLAAVGYAVSTNAPMGLPHGLPVHTGRGLQSLDCGSDLNSTSESGGGGSGFSLAAAIAGKSDCCASLDNAGGVVLYGFIVLYCFLGLAIVCDEYFCESLDALSEALNLSEDVAGATFMAAGSSAPELFTALVTILVTGGSEGLGTIVGSAVFNIMVIVGVTAIFAGQALSIWWYPLARDCIVYLISILLMLWAVADKQVTWWEATLLVIGYFFYIGLMAANDAIVTRVEEWEARRAGGAAIKPHHAPSLVAADEAKAQAEFEGSNDDIEQRLKQAAESLAAQGEHARRRSSVKSNTSDGTKSPGPKKRHKRHSTSRDEKGHRGANPMLRTEFRGTYTPGKEDLAGQRQERRRQYMGNVVVAILGVSKAKHQLLKSIKHLRVPDAERSTAPMANNWTDAKETTRPAASTDGDNGAQRVPIGARVSAIIAALGEVLAWPLAKAMQFSIPPCGEDKWAKWYFVTFVNSILWIGLLSYVMVDFGARIGCILKVPGLVMGLVVLAAGTSVPDALSSVMVAKNGQGDMAVANVLGSNVFNILLGLGLPWLVRTLVDGKPFALNPDEDVVQPIIVLVIFLLFFISTIIMLGWRLNKLLGGIFIFGHAVFLTWSLLTLLPDPVISI